MDGKRRLGLLLLSSSLVLLPMAVLQCGEDSTSAAPALNRLDRMLAAERDLSYEGMKQLVYGEGRQTRQQFLFVDHDGPGSTFVEAAGVPVGRARRWKQRGSPFYWLANRQLLLRNYRVVETGTERVCDRDGVALELRSVHEGRPSMHMVVDEETGLLLSADSFDYRGRLTFHSAFTTLIVEGASSAVPVAEESPVHAEGWEARSRGRGAKPPVLPFEPLEPKLLPAGFERRGDYSLKQWTPGLQTVYSDGLTWITFRQTNAPSGAEEMVVHQLQRGLRTSLRLVYRGVQVCLEGQLDPEVLLQTLRSVGPRGERGRP